MPETIDISVNAKVKLGPTIAFASQIDVDAYDKFEIVVPGTVDNVKTIELVPTGDVKILLIKSSVYDATLTYAVNGGDTLALDQPHSFIGSGSISALSGDLASLVFTNDTGDDATIQILVGRNAITP